MAAPIVNLRVPAALLALIDAKATAAGSSRSAVILDILADALMGGEPEPARAAPKVKRAAKPPAKPMAAPTADKVTAAREALAKAEARTGAPRAKLDTSAVPVFGGGKRAAYQKRPAGKR